MLTARCKKDLYQKSREKKETPAQRRRRNSEKASGTRKSARRGLKRRRGIARRADKAQRAGTPAAVSGSIAENRSEVEKRWAKRAYSNRTWTRRAKYYRAGNAAVSQRHMHMATAQLPIGDVVARVKRMRGFNVLHPMGGTPCLPAENAAIKKILTRASGPTKHCGISARAARFGFSYDWRRQISTCEPEYYH